MVGADEGKAQRENHEITVWLRESIRSAGFGQSECLCRAAGKTERQRFESIHRGRLSGVGFQRFKCTAMHDAPLCWVRMPL